MRSLSISRPSPPPDTGLDGFDCDGSTWRLDLERYRGFLAAVTGIRPTADASAADCYRVGNRLEAFVAEKRRTGDWDDSLADDYPEIDSLDQIYALARFFRRCHEDHLPATSAPSA
jgi:hypothetical protein